MKFKSIYVNLKISETQIQFINGEYETKDKKEIEILKSFDFVQCLEEPKQQKSKEETTEGQ